MAKQSPTQKIATKRHIARLERERQQVRLIQTISFAAIAIVVLLVGYGILDTTYLKLRQPVAEVNGEKIFLNYWQERIQFSRVNLANYLQQYQYYQQNFGMDTAQQQQEIQFYLQSPELLGEQVLNQLIDETLVRQEAQKREITVTMEEVEAKIQGSLNFYPDGTPTPTGNSCVELRNCKSCQRCDVVERACVPDPCCGKTCDGGAICDPKDGTCVAVCTRKNGETFPAKVSEIPGVDVQTAAKIIVVQDISEQDRLRRKADQIELINELSGIVNSSLSIGTIFRMMVSEIRKLIDYTRASLLLYDEKEDNLLIFALDTEMKTIMKKGVRAPIEGTSAGWVVRNNRPWINYDLREAVFPLDAKLFAEGRRSSSRSSSP